jgi:hypothetical protein
MSNLVEFQNVQTMTSLELVNLINSVRIEEGRKQIRHNDFMAKMLKVLGEEAARNFSHSYIGKDGTTRPCYALPKRESNLMVMSESYKVQAAVYDKMIELEEQQKPQLPTTYIEALQALIESEQAKQLALENQAKAEAKVAILTTVIDNEFGYCSILRAAKFLGVRETVFKWQTLKAVTLGLGFEVKKVPSPRYEFQHLYPIKAFQIAYPDYDFDDLKPESHDDKMELVLK